MFSWSCRENAHFFGPEFREEGDLMKKRVVITGYGLVTPLGSGPEKVWEKIRNGQSGISTLPENYSKFRSSIGGQCTEFDITQYIPVKEANRIYSNGSCRSHRCGKNGGTRHGK